MRNHLTGFESLGKSSFEQQLHCRESVGREEGFIFGGIPLTPPHSHEGNASRSS